MGYVRAGFDVVGVDLHPQKNYPYEFHQADALTYPLVGFDAVHASPPCQAYSAARYSSNKVHPKLIEATRERLLDSGLPFIIENVVGAPLRDPATLCGTMFDLTAEDDDGATLFLRRHRLFETSFGLAIPIPCRCLEFRKRGWKLAGVYGGGSQRRSQANPGKRGGYTPATEVRRLLMDLPNVTQPEVSQALPPAFTAWIGKQLLAMLGTT